MVSWSVAAVSVTQRVQQARLMSVEAPSTRGMSRRTPRGVKTAAVCCRHETSNGNEDKAAPAC